MLQARDLHKSYGDNRVLAGVDVDLKPGTITALIGPSGSGKSTLMRNLALLEEPDSGTIRINGLEYVYPAPEDGNPPPRWPLVTVVFQQLFLWPHMTLRRNIALPLETRYPDSVDEHVDRIVAELDIGRFVDRYPNEVSLGQKQLAAIARAFALDPEFLLLDEITSALDVEYVSRILGLVRERKEHGAGVLIVTHYIDFARTSADQVLFIDDARIIESGTPDILDSPETKRLRKFLSLVLAAR